MSEEATTAPVIEEAPPAPAPPAPWETLTKREVEIALMLAEGKNNHAIAEHLFISVKTVDTHRGHILKKLGLSGNVALCRFCIKNGYVTL